MVKLQRVIQILEEKMPRYLAEDWDNVGLQVGNPQADTKKILLSLDVNLDVVKEALLKGADTIIAHHPLIFKPLKTITSDNPVGKAITTLIENKINLYVAHTNLDSAEEGVNQVLAEALGLKNIEVLSPSYEEELLKLVVFVPEESASDVAKALGDAGAGWIGNYSHCSFQSPGFGTFIPREGSNPYIGEQGKLEKVAEVRVETILPKKRRAQVVRAMLKAHPYEEVAFDLYPVLNAGNNLGLGRVGRLEEPISLEEFIRQVKKALGLPQVTYGGNLTSKIEKVALCGGSGSSLTGKALFKGADVFLTGDIKYHEGQEMLARGMAFVDAGHNPTEKLIIPFLAKSLKGALQEAKLGVDLEISDTNTNPFEIL